MSAVAVRDPGPMARLRDVQADEGAPGVIFQRLTEGDTLATLAKAWALPKGAFTRWFMEKHGDLFDAAARVRADELVNEALAVADEQAEVVKKDGTTFDPDVGRDKLRVDTRLKLAEKMDRVRYGSKDVGPAGGMTVIVDRSCGGSVAITSGAGSVLVTGGVSAEREIFSPEASAIPAEKSLEKLEI